MNFVILKHKIGSKGRWQCLPDLYTSRTRAEDRARALTLENKDYKYIVRNICV